MITIYKSNTMADAAKYVMNVLSRVDKSNLDVVHTVIVPDRASLEAERALLRAVGGSFNIQVRTFRRLAADILPKYEYLSKQAGIMALSGIIGDKRDSLTCFKKGVNTPGFVENVYDTVSMMKYCRITPNMLCRDLPRSVAGKAHDLAIVYQAYLDYTRDRFIDSADKLDLLCDAIAQTDFARDGYFYLFDFDNFSKQELGIVEQLMLRSRGVTVACCVSDRRSDAHLYLNDIYLGVKEICRQNGIIANEISGGGYVSDVAKQIGENMYRYGEAETVEAGDRVEIFEGANRMEEVYALACRVQQYVREGRRYGDVYVVASDVGKYYNAVSTVFSQFDIPYFCDRQYPLSDHPYASYAVDYLTMCRNNAKLDSVLPFVKNRLFSDGSENVFLFENYCLKYNVSYRFDKFDLGKDSRYFAQADEFRERFYLLYRDNIPPKRATVGEYVAFVRKLIDASDLREKNKSLLQSQRERKLDFEAKVTEQVADKFDGVLVQAEKVLGNRFVELEEFVKILSAGLAAVKISVIPLYNDCVIFANMAKARKHDVKFLALLGANQGAMPIVKSDTKLLSDRNIKDLNANGIYLEPMIFTENRRERFSLFQLALEPTEKLYVSYATADSDGSALLPSPFVSAIKSLFVQKKNSVNSDGKLVDEPLRVSRSTASEVYTEKQAIALLVQLNRRVKDHQSADVPCFAALKELFGQEAHRYESDENGKNITVSRGKELYFKKSETSVSQVTDFYNCPYKFFFDYGLNVKPRPVAEMQSADLGNVLHEVLDRYVSCDDLREKTEIGQMGWDFLINESDERTQQRAENIFAAVLSKDEYGGIRNDPVMTGVLKQLKSESVRMCKVVKGQLAESDFHPSYGLFDRPTEIKFDAASGNTVNVSFDGGGFALKGKIDRVDVWDDYFVVIDYKSGRAASQYSENELYIGHKLQLLVYLRAVEDILKKNYPERAFRPAGFYYFAMHDDFGDVNDGNVYGWNGRTLEDLDVAARLDNNLPDNRSEKLGIRTRYNKDNVLVFDKRGRLSSKFLTAEQIEAQVEYAFELIKRAGALMTNGYAAVSPYDGACKFCNCKCICNFGHTLNYSERKVSENATAKTFVAQSDRLKK